MTREAELELEIARLREALEFLNARIVTSHSKQITKERIK